MLCLRLKEMPRSRRSSPAMTPLRRPTTIRAGTSTFRTSLRIRESKTNWESKRTRTSKGERTRAWSMTEKSPLEAKLLTRRPGTASVWWKNHRLSANRPLTNSRSGIPSSRTSATPSAPPLMPKMLFAERDLPCHHLSPSPGTLAPELTGSLPFPQSPSSNTKLGSANAAARMVSITTILKCSDLASTFARMALLSGNE